MEKNISLSIWEGRKMIEAAKKYGRVVQAGTAEPQRTLRLLRPRVHPRRRLGQGAVREGLRHAGRRGRRLTSAPVPDSRPPPGLDWDRWLGPAPSGPTIPRASRLVRLLGLLGGNASDAIHTLDLARMVLGDPPQPKVVHASAADASSTTAARCPTCRSSPISSTAGDELHQHGLYALQGQARPEIRFAATSALTGRRTPTASRSTAPSE